MRLNPREGGRSRRGIDWSLPLDGRFLFWVGGFAVLAFTLAWWALSLDWHVTHPDLGFYQSVGEATVAGQIPYRDFDPTYPPAALPILVLPSLLGAQPGIWESYAVRFEHLMLLVGWLFVLAVVGALAALGASRRRTVLSLGFVALAPILVGSILPARFDLWPAALATAALAAIVAGRERLGALVLGLAIAAKVYPVVLLPLVLLYVWRQRGGRAAIGALGIAGATALAVALPFLVLAPGGVWQSLHDLFVRPLQVESTGAAVLWVAHAVVGTPLDLQVGYGSNNLVGPLPELAVALQTVALGVALVAIWGWFARRGTPTRDQVITASAAAVCAFVVLGKVLSGQYVIWLIPLVALLPGRRGVVAAVVLAAALVLMQQWYPARYPAWIAGGDPAVSWIVLARDLVLLGLLATLALPGAWFAGLADRLGALVGRPTERLVPRAAGLEPAPQAVQPAFIATPERLTKEP